MKVYSIDEINTYGIHYQAVKDSLKLEFLNRVFIRSGDFPKRFREQAIQAYTAYREDSLKCFLVETPFLLTLWTEEKKEQLNQLIPEKLPEIANSSPENLEFPVCNLRTYRGVPYKHQETFSPDHPNSFTPKQRIYRGQAY